MNKFQQNEYLSQDKPLRNVQQNLNNEADKNKLNNTIRYWTNQYSCLLSEKVVIMYGTNEFKIIKTMPPDVLRQVMKLNLLPSLEAFNLLTNKAFVYLRFNSGQDAAFFQNNTSAINNHNMEFLGYLQQLNETWGTIAGVPYLKVKNDIKEIMSPYAEVSEITPTVLKFPEQKLVESAPTKFKILMHENTTVDSLPNFIYFGQLRAYLSVTGKAPVCYNCEQTTHLSKNCTLVFCKKCRRMVLPSHSCKESYADKLRIDPTNIDQILMLASEQQFPTIDGSELSSFEDDNISDKIDSQDDSDANSETTIPYSKTIPDENNILSDYIAEPTTYGETSIRNIEQDVSNYNTLVPEIKNTKQKKKKDPTKSKVSLTTQTKKIRISNKQKKDATGIPPTFNDNVENKLSGISSINSPNIITLNQSTELKYEEKELDLESPMIS